MHDLNVTLVQSDIIWEDGAANREMFAEKIASTNQKTDVYVLPEMFNSGFSMRSKVLAEEMDGPSIAWMREWSRNSGADIAASLIIHEHGNYFNRLVWMRPDGDHFCYDKRHLFRMAGEHKHFTAGERRIVVHSRGWRICPLICYDLRFPVWSRSRGDYDALVYVANWPEPRRAAWNILLAARAVENQCVVIGVNRTGEDGTGKRYAGDSAVYDARGEKISRIRPYENGTERVTLSAEDLNDYRNTFEVGLDADAFTLEPVERKNHEE